MLIVPEKYIAKSLKPPTQYGKTTKQEINNPSEVPEQWELGKSYEADWATNITHWQIKEFCRHLCNEKKDQWQNDAPYLLPLYQNFIKDRGIDSPCIPALYEKLCYIRDRIIYRPSYEPMSSGEIVQTSAQLGQEVQSLPNAAYLYQAILDVYQGLISCMKSEMQNCQHGIYIAMLTEMWVGRVNEGDLSNLCGLGHKKTRLQKLGKRDEDGMYSFPTYISHLLEIENIDYIRKYVKKYWEPLEYMHQASWKVWREQKFFPDGQS